MQVSEEHLHLAGVIWRYHQLCHQPIQADVIVALGTNDIRVAEFAAQLYTSGYGRLLVCTGGNAHAGDLLATSWDGQKPKCTPKSHAAEKCRNNASSSSHEP